jgi:hypothetical protein
MSERAALGRVVSLLVALAGAGLICAGLAGMGGSQGVSRLVRFREQGPAVTAAGFLLFALFGTAVALFAGVLATGGRDRVVLRLANLAAKLSFALAVAFMFLFPHLHQFDGKTMTLRAIIYPVCVAALGVGWLLRRPRGPYPLLVDLAWGFTFTFDIVSNDLRWYGAFGAHDVWADFVHLTNSVPMFLAIACMLLGIERWRDMRVGFWGVLLVALFGFFAAHSAWEMWEFAMDHFAGTGLQPGGMGEASRHNLLGLSGAVLGALLLIAWRRRGTLDAAAVEPTAGYLRELASVNRPN